MNCYQAKAGELAKQWYVIDATDMVVGRLAAQIAPILMGKHRPTYTPHIDTGDYVIVTNVDKVVFTGNKWQQKSYQRYTGHPGGQKEEVAWKLFQRRPERILQLAVQRMMPKNKIGRHMLSKMKLYVGAQHPHQAQSPIPLEPLSGRPTPAGAVLAPKPRSKTGTPRPEAATPAPAEPPIPTQAPGAIAEVQAPTPIETPAPGAEAQAPTPIETPAPAAEAQVPPPAEAPVPTLAETPPPVETPAAEAPAPTSAEMPPPVETPAPPAEAPAPTSAEMPPPVETPAAVAEAQAPLPGETPPPTSAETPSVAEPAAPSGTESSPGGE